MRYRIQHFLLLLCSLLLSFPALAQSPTGATSLGDLAQWPEARGSNPSGLIRINDLLFFSAYNETSGRELWASDGTPSGTRLLKDINPGGDGSGPRDFYELDDHLVFTAIEHPGELWVSDGTSDGTRLITDGIRHPGLEVRELFVFDGYAYMSGSEEHHGSEVWRYSLRADELVRVTDIVPGPGDARPGDFKIVAGRLLFNTEAGLHVIDAELPGAAPFLPSGVDLLRFGYNSSIIEFNDYFYFAAYSTGTGNELWRTDGTAEGTELVIDLRQGSISSYPQSLAVYFGGLYFVADPYFSGKQLYVTDGTAAGTSLVRNQLLAGGRSAKNNVPAGFSLDLQPQESQSPESKASMTQATEQWPLEILSVRENGGVLYFTGKNITDSTLLWRSDGTATGSEALRLPSDIGAYVNFATPFTFRDQQLVPGYSHETGYELWRIVDGKSIKPVGEFHPGPASGIAGVWLVGDTAFASISKSGSGVELWELQDNVAAPQLVANIMPDDSADSSIHSLIDSEDGVLFLGPGDSYHDEAVWRTDGSPGNTVRLHEFEANSDSGCSLCGVSIRGLMALNSRSIFSVYSYDASLDGEWAINGDEVTKISDQRLDYPVQLGDQAFSSQNGDLWSTSGEQDSVNLIAAINDGTFGFSYFALLATPSENNVWFFSGNQQQGSAVWRSDGTSTGTVLAADVTKHNSLVEYFPLAAIGDDFYFLTSDGGGVTLWRTGETGTTLLARIADRWFNQYILHPANTRLGDKLLLNLKRPIGGGTDLWATDGTVNGTLRLADIASGTNHFVGSPMVVLDNQAYFQGFDETHGYTLWRSDGTRGGTGMAFDHEPGFDLSPPESLALHNGALYFVARTAKTGEEIWKFDGTRAEQVTELMPGTLSANPYWLKSVGGRLYFTAYVQGQGRELMVLDE